MTLPTSGSLSGDQIDDEFPDSIDGGRPMKLSEYRGQRASKNGALYTLPTVSQSNPTGQISYSDFRGVSAGYFIDVLIVGSGGGGGTPNTVIGAAAGGGGGGFAQIVNGLFVIPGVNYSLTVGGVDGVIQDGRPGQNGKDSSFTHNGVTYISRGGGGGGGTDRTNINNRRGRDGGNGGGQGNARISTDSQTLYGEAVTNNVCQAGDTCRGNRGGGAVYQPADSSEGGGGGGTGSQGGRGWFTSSFDGGNAPADSFGIGGLGIGVGFLNGASFNVSNGSTTKAVDGFGGGGGGGYSVTGTSVQPSGRNGGGDGTNPFAADNQLNRDGYNRTGGGGGGGSVYGSGGGIRRNGAGGGGTGVVIVRYRSSTILDNMGDPDSNFIRRNGNPDTTWKYLIFGRNERHSDSLNLTFRA